MELWEALSKRRKEIGMQYTDIERLSGLSISTIKKILGGHIAAPSYESVQAIAYAMKMSMAELDRMIAEPVDTETTLSDSALRLAAIYDSLDDTGKEAVTAVTDSQVKRIEKYGRCTDSPKRIPILGTACQDGTVEVKYAARKEQKELEHTQTPVLSD